MPLSNPLEIMRKSPAQARSQATVDMILEAAAQVLQAEGEPAATTNRIAERAGFSIGTLYQYFRNREAILAALATREYHRVLAQVESDLGAMDPADPEPAIRATLRSFLGAFGGRFGVRRAVVLAALRRAPDEPRPSAQAVEPLLTMIEARFEGHIAPLGPVGRSVLAQAILGAVRSAVIDRSPYLGSTAHEEALLRLIMGMLRAPATPPAPAGRAAPPGRARRAPGSRIR